MNEARAMSRRLAVVIPVKNDRNGLAITLEALWAADPEGKHLEIAVIDANSKDGTSDYLLANAERIDHVRSAPDRGTYDGMNAGKNLTQAPWIWFLGAGDVPNSDVLTRTLDMMSMWSITGLHAFEVQLSGPLESGVPERYPARWDASLRWRNTAHHQGLIYPRQLLKDLHYDLALSVLADYNLNLSLFESNIQCTLHNEILCMVQPGGVSRNFNRALYMQEWRMKRKILHGVTRWVQPPWLLAKYVFKQFRLSRPSDERLT